MVADLANHVLPASPFAGLRLVELTPRLAAELDAAAADPIIAASYDLRGEARAGQRLFAAGDDATAYLCRKQRLSRAALLPEAAPHSAVEASDQLVGVFTLHRGELSYFVLRSHWGRGYGRQIAQAACQAAFDELCLSALDAIVVATNAPSRKIVEALGFRSTGHSHMSAAHRGRVAVIRYTLTRQLSAFTAS